MGRGSHTHRGTGNRRVFGGPVAIQKVGVWCVRLGLSVRRVGWTGRQGLDLEGL